MTSDFSLCILCNHPLAKHRIVKYTNTSMEIACSFTGERMEDQDECSCNGGFLTKIYIVFKEVEGGEKIK